jgi:hypothetical protein
MSTDLSDAAAELIAQLPEDANQMSVSDAQAFYALGVKTAQAGIAADDELATLLELAGSRGAGDQSPLVEFLTGEERTALDRLMRRSLDAERASVALNAWEAHSGLDELTLRLTGIPALKLVEPTMTLTEDPDGGLVFVRPKR